MFSPRLLAVFAVLATVAAVPATDRPAPQPITTIYNEDFESPWISFPPIFSNLFAPLWRLIPTFADIGPKIISDDKKFEVVMSVKDYKKEDLKVKLKGDFIFIQGSHETNQGSHDVFASQFFHTYSIPANASTKDITALYTSDKYLVVTIPIKEGQEGGDAQDVDVEVPIKDTDKPYKDDSEEKSTAATPVSEVTAAEDTKEATTASEREEVTEKDNVIPHGNEINEINP